MRCMTDQKNPGLDGAASVLSFGTILMGLITLVISLYVLGTVIGP